MSAVSVNGQGVVFHHLTGKCANYQVVAGCGTSAIHYDSAVTVRTANAIPTLAQRDVIGSLSSVLVLRRRRFDNQICVTHAHGPLYGAVRGGPERWGARLLQVAHTEFYGRVGNRADAIRAAS